MISAERLARISKVLSVETRVRIIHLLKDRSLCVGALSSRLDVTQGAVSQHLRILRDAGLLIDEKRGYFVHYRVNPKTLDRWKTMLDRLLQIEAVDNSKGKGASVKERNRPCPKKRRHAKSRKN